MDIDRVKQDLQLLITRSAVSSDGPGAARELIQLQQKIVKIKEASGLLPEIDSSLAEINSLLTSIDGLLNEQ